MRDLHGAPLELWDGEEPLPATTRSYDCACLAFVLRLDDTYVTADRRFWQRAQAQAELRDQTLLLTELR